MIGHWTNESGVLQKDHNLLVIDIYMSLKAWDWMHSLYDSECIVNRKKIEPWDTGTFKSQAIEELLQRLRTGKWSVITDSRREYSLVSNPSGCQYLKA